MRASLFVTCLIDMYQPSTGVAAVELLRAAGCEVSCPMGQTCCGQPAWNSGFADEGAKVARTTLDALENDGAEVVVVPSGSCATMMTVFWPEMFEVVGDHKSAHRARRLGVKVRELSSFLVERMQQGELELAPGASQTVAYHHSCHMLRELRIETPPLDLLEAAGCAVAEWPDAYRCCGFGGLFSMKLPETSVAMADEKLRSLPSDVRTIVGSDGSCLMHLRGRMESEGIPVVARHLAEVLAERLASGDAT